MGTIVIAESWDAYAWYCKKHDLDPTDRKEIIPLVTFSCVYRLLGRTLTGWAVARVGKIQDYNLRRYKQELRKQGVIIND
jgi:hypothetical protein